MSDGTIWYGECANLSSFRVADASLRQSALEQSLHDREETILLGPVPVLAQFKLDSQDDKYDDEPEFIPGSVVITSQQLLFWQDATEEPLHDLRVDAVCIDLHALTQSTTTSNVDGDDDPNSPPTAIYIQMSNGGDDSERPDGTTDLFELTLRPDSEDDPASLENSLQRMFQAIATLISLNPIDPNELDEPTGAESFMSDGPIMSADPFDDVGDDDNHDDDLWIAPSSYVFSGREATPEERDVMLERLDNLLIVPEELESNEPSYSNDNGQFDDADSDTDLA
jgi:Regulator of volume decrease after cellular swelling